MKVEFETENFGTVKVSGGKEVVVLSIDGMEYKLTNNEAKSLVEGLKLVAK
jgi:hypothetical protein